MVRRGGLSLVKGSDDIEPAEYDMELPNIGKLYFVLEFEEDEESVVIAYYKRGSLKRSASVFENKYVPQLPYARAFVRLNAVEKYLNRSLKAKVKRKIVKLQESLRVIDNLLGASEGRRTLEIDV